jgi:hypothetical protein
MPRFYPIAADNRWNIRRPAAVLPMDNRRPIRQTDDEP